MFSKLCRSLLVGGLLCALSGVALAQATGAWPAKPIRIVVPNPPGVGSDTLARLLGLHMAKSLGQPVVIENKPGASGIIGNDYVAKSPPDGYTVLFSNASFTVVPVALGLKRPYDLVRDLAPVAQVGQGGNFLIASNDFPASNLDQLVKLAKDSPGKYTYGAFGIGSVNHLIMEWLMRRTGAKMEIINYKSTAQIIQDMQGGVLKLGWVDIATSVGVISAGKVKVLAYSGATLPPGTPRPAATMVEQGYPFDTIGWYGVFVAAGTPKAIVDRLNTEVNTAMQSPEFLKMMNTLNVPNAPSNTAEQFAATVRKDISIWSGIVRDSNIKIDE